MTQPILAGFILCFCISVCWAQDNLRLPGHLEVTPVNYLTTLKIKDVNRRLDRREKKDICRLFADAYLVSKRKYHQDYILSLDTPVYKLLKGNFPNISQVEKGSEGVFLGDIYQYIKASPECSARKK